jgi:Holliday junction resolvasome RuvABC endonuclease subunit
MTVIVGIDPSLACSGVAKLTRTTAATHWETWRGRSVALPKGIPADEVMRLTRRRQRIVLREVLALIPAQVDLFVIEGPSYGSRTAQSKADERAGLRWMLLDQLYPRGPVAVVAPKTRALLAAGNGDANKDDVIAAMRDAFPDAHIPDGNVADAVALAAAGAHALGISMPYTNAQATAHGKVSWPSEIAGSPAGERES